MRTAFRCRAYPTDEQAANLARTFGCVRKVWNEVLDWRTRRYRTDGIRTNYAETDRFLTELKKRPDSAFLKEVSSVPLQQTLRHQSRAMNNFFAHRAGYPCFKPRRGRKTATYTRSAFRYRNGQLVLARQTGPLRFVWSWADIDQVAIEPSMVTVTHDADGRWYVTFQLDVPDPQPLPKTGNTVGIDMGIRSFAVTSDGEVTDNPRLLHRKQRNLARYQRRMARKQKGSKNRAKAARKVAVAHGKVRRARSDFLHATSTRLVRANDVIVIEDLNVSGMLRNRRLARAISDCGWSSFRQMIDYKALKWGKTLVVIDRFCPSSKKCSGCGHVLDQLNLDTRTWRCPSCGTRHDRDLNAAKNILAEGLSVTACRADISLQGDPFQRSATKQEPQPARAEISVLQGGE
ncbi:RNA-guided endonuclease InsQ/TnpB family protein [Mycobacterium sp.]|uniref:RNA-guided endonuclease InsQ/TnpB family protein n=1 Tax=Mycobacterium sp. TaxID=1785 RepID=UPI003D6ABD1E